MKFGRRRYARLKSAQNLERRRTAGGRRRADRAMAVRGPVHEHPDWPKPTSGRDPGPARPLGARSPVHGGSDGAQEAVWTAWAFPTYFSRSTILFCRSVCDLMVWVDFDFDPMVLGAFSGDLRTPYANLIDFLAFKRPVCGTEKLCGAALI